MLTLAVVKSSGWVGPRVGEVLSISGYEPQVVGRSSDADISIDHPKISRAHAWFLEDQEGWSVEDLQSKNGTSLNGEPVDSKRPLEEGDLLQFASFHFRVMSITRSDACKELAAYV